MSVIETDTYRSPAHHFLLTLQSNHGPISYRFRDKWDFGQKSLILPTPVYFVSTLKGFPCSLVSAHGLKINERDGATGPKKRSVAISSAVWIQSPNVTDSGRTDTGRQQSRTWSYNIAESQLIRTSLEVPYNTVFVFKIFTRQNHQILMYMRMNYNERKLLFQ